MNASLAELAGAAAGGILLGVLFFAGLYFTVASLPHRRRKGMTLLVSALARLGVVIAGFCFIGAGSWPRMVAALLGFIAARQVLLMTLGRSPNPEESQES